MLPPWLEELAAKEGGREVSVDGEGGDLQGRSCILVRFSDSLALGRASGLGNLTRQGERLTKSTQAWILQLPTT